MLRTEIMQHYIFCVPVSFYFDHFSFSSLYIDKLGAHLILRFNISIFLVGAAQRAFVCCCNGAALVSRLYTAPTATAGSKTQIDQISENSSASSSALRGAHTSCVVEPSEDALWEDSMHPRQRVAAHKHFKSLKSSMLRCFSHPKLPCF